MSCIQSSSYESRSIRCPCVGFTVRYVNCSASLCEVRSTCSFGSFFDAEQSGAYGVCCANCPTDSSTQWSTWSTTCGYTLRTRTVTTCTSLGLPSTAAACDQKCTRQLETERRDASTTPCPCSGSSLTLNSTTQQNISCGQTLPACPSDSFCEAAYAVCCVNCPVAGTTAGQWGAGLRRVGVRLARVWTTSAQQSHRHTIADTKSCARM